MPLAGEILQMLNPTYQNKLLNETKDVIRPSTDI